MKKHPFGSLAAKVPVIGQGSWQFPGSKQAIENAKLALRAGIDLGMTHIDTAEMYGDSELIIGDAIKGLNRDSLFIVSKVLPSNASYNGTIKACEKSLRRLGIDFLDCYLLHWRGSFDLSETMGALEQLVDDGKIRSLGVSNFDVDDLQEASIYLNKYPIVCNQVLYNLYERGIDRNLIPYCIEKNIAVVGYTPFGRRSIPQPGTKSGAVLHDIAKKHNASPAQIMLAFLVRLDILFAIPKAAQVDHTTENAKAGSISLEKEDIERIDEAFPVPRKDQPLAML